MPGAQVSLSAERETKGHLFLLCTHIYATKKCRGCVICYLSFTSCYFENTMFPGETEDWLSRGHRLLCGLVPSCGIQCRVLTWDVYWCTWIGHPGLDTCRNLFGEWDVKVIEGIGVREREEREERALYKLLFFFCPPFVAVYFRACSPRSIPALIICWVPHIRSAPPTIELESRSPNPVTTPVWRFNPFHNPSST